MDEERKKEWLAKQIDTILVAITDQFKEQENEFIVESKKITDAQREVQKTVLAVIGLLVSLIIGFTVTKNISNLIFVNFIMVVITVGVFIFISSLIYEIYVTRFLNRIRKSYQHQIGDIGHIRGDFLHISTQIENYKSDQFQTYVKFCWTMSAAAQGRTLEAYENLYNSRQGYKSLKLHAKDRIGRIKYNLELGVSLYDKLIQEFEKEELLSLVINRLKPIQDYKNRKTEIKKN